MVTWTKPNENQHFAALTIGLLASVRCTIDVAPKDSAVPFIRGYRAVLEYLDLRGEVPVHRKRVWVGEAADVPKVKREAVRAMKLAAQSPDVVFPI